MITFNKQSIKVNGRTFVHIESLAKKNKKSHSIGFIDAMIKFMSTKLIKVILQLKGLLNQ